MTATIALDLKGLKCPLPALRVRKALSMATAGDVLVVSCTDPLSAIDIPHLLSETRDTLIDRGSDGETLVFRIRREMR